MQQGMWLAVICMLYGMYTPSFVSISCLHARPLPRSISLFLTLLSIRFRCLAWLLLPVLVPVLLPMTLRPDWAHRAMWQALLWQVLLRRQRFRHFITAPSVLLVRLRASFLSTSIFPCSTRVQGH